ALAVRVPAQERVEDADARAGLEAEDVDGDHPVDAGEVGQRSAEDGGLRSRAGGDAPVRRPHGDVAALEGEDAGGEEVDVLVRHHPDVAASPGDDAAATRAGEELGSRRDAPVGSEHRDVAGGLRLQGLAVEEDVPDRSALLPALGKEAGDRVEPALVALVPGAGRVVVVDARLAELVEVDPIDED